MFINILPQEIFKAFDFEFWYANFRKALAK